MLQDDITKQSKSTGFVENLIYTRFLFKILVHFGIQENHRFLFCLLQITWSYIHKTLITKMEI